MHTSLTALVARWVGSDPGWARICTFLYDPDDFQRCEEEWLDNQQQVESTLSNWRLSRAHGQLQMGAEGVLGNFAAYWILAAQLSSQFHTGWQTRIQGVRDQLHLLSTHKRELVSGCFNGAPAEERQLGQSEWHEVTTLYHAGQRLWKLGKPVTDKSPLQLLRYYLPLRLAPDSVNGTWQNRATALWEEVRTSEFLDPGGSGFFNQGRGNNTTGSDKQSAKRSHQSK